MKDLHSIIVGGGPDGREIQLAQVADFRIAKTPAAIRREDRKTFTWVAVNYSGDKRDEGKAQLEEVMKSLDYPPGYGWSFSFWQQREEQEDKDFLFSFLLALFMVYFVMAALFESITHPFAIMLSLPFGLVGVAWLLYLTGTPFNIMSKIGLMVLVGVVVNNGIVLLDHINNLRRAGLERMQAILQGCRDRLRPIMMTATTTVVGLLPLAMGDSGLFDLRYFPLARTIMGGLISSTVLTLIVLPTYYTFFDDLAEWVKSIWRESAPAPHPEPASGND
jgi:HAE1 family hydrophobic/amphiphilic exporter-1